ncbi:efflux RND transporter periplasmic adaptor subunit [Candidatus Uabimicrobium sp. HlEnr_7]|uniref:efflux RND transporter periplasmic adaptor subunit n=1 Tax=Candidatus Uabimicrobium helgolandensis TaxID=3095367 RepID=UPI0035582961
MSYRIAIVFLLCACIFGQEKVIGTSQPFLEIEMVPLQPGILQTLNVQEGDSIKKGQVVALLNSNFLQPSLDIAKMRAQNQGEIIAAKSQLKLAKNKLQTIKELQRRNHARSAEVEKTQAEVSLAEANVRIMTEKNKVAMLEVKQIEFQIKQHQVESPINGVVRKIIKQIGESISGTQPLIELVQLHKIKVESFPFFEQIKNVNLGDQVKVLFVETNQRTIGKVIFIDPVVDFASNTVRIVIEIGNNEKKYRSGLKCWVYLPGKM